ncbi:hypothetical protein JOD24_000174 [Kroppenstedtia sanguinis]
MINQRMGGGRESCAAIARPGSGSDPGETCALWVQSDRATSSLSCFRKNLPLPRRSDLEWPVFTSLPDGNGRVGEHDLLT